MSTELTDQQKRDLIGTERTITGTEHTIPVTVTAIHNGGTLARVRAVDGSHFLTPIADLTMPFTRGAREVPNQTPASTSDARKRRDEQDFLHSTIGEQPVKFSAADLSPSLPDTSGWVRREPGDVIPGDVPVLWRDQDGTVGFTPGVPEGGDEYTAGDEGFTYWTPPPVEPAPWERLSTDRDQPTLARVTWCEPIEYEATAPLFIENGYVWRVLDSTDPHSDAGSHKIGPAKSATLALLHTYSPETHVPVERALIDEAAALSRYWTDAKAARPNRSAIEFFRSLAALADGAQS